MKRAFSRVGVGVAAFLVIAQAAIGAPQGNFTVTPASIDLPEDDSLYPDGPSADVVNANCTACHSASMALLQPKLTPGQWSAIVEKMRTVYQAPIAQADVPAILVYLAAMPGQRSTPTVPQSKATP